MLDIRYFAVMNFIINRNDGTGNILKDIIRITRLKFRSETESSNIPLFASTRRRYL